MKHILTTLKEWLEYHFFKLFSKKKLKIQDIYMEGFDDRTYSTYKDYQIFNNNWGTFKIPQKYKKEYIQLISDNGWMFQTPKKNYRVIGYPSLHFFKDFSKIKELKPLSVNYDFSLTMEKYKKYNLAFDFWFSDVAEFDFAKMTHELMIWEDYYVARPFGKYKGTVEIDGVKYRIYHGFIDKTDENLGTKGWNYTAFLRVERTNKSSLNVNKFLETMLNKGLINEEEFLLAGEIGNEVYNATGRTIINNFTILDNE